mgnify:CR=1 FL=1
MNMRNKTYQAGSGVGRMLSKDDESRVVMGVVSGKPVRVTVNGVKYIATTTPPFLKDNTKDNHE